MVPSSHLVERGWCLAKPGEVYLIYLPEGGSTVLTAEQGDYSVQWFDPVDGGQLQTGSVHEISGSGAHSLGRAPSKAENDWIILVRKKD